LRVRDEARDPTVLNDGVVLFGVLLWVFHVSTNAPLFRAGCFVESLAPQTLAVFVLRPAGNPFPSRPRRPLRMSVIAVVRRSPVSCPSRRWGLSCG
jgi:hypothetical protein